MSQEVLEALQRELRPEAWLAAMASLVVLTLLAAHLYLLKPPIDRYRELSAASAKASVESTLEKAKATAATIARFENDLSDMKARLYGGASALPLEKIESYVIDRLDHMSVRHDVQLASVKPGPIGHVLMFDELPYDVEVVGGYFAVFDWLRDVEMELRPMVVKQFDMKNEPKTDRVKVTLQLVSYRPSGAGS